jgi:hypothetical protein
MDQQDKMLFEQAKQFTATSKLFGSYKTRRNRKGGINC